MSKLPPIKENVEAGAKPVVGKPPSGSRGENPFGEGPSGQNPFGEGPSGANPSGEGPSGENPLAAIGKPVNWNLWSMKRAEATSKVVKFHKSKERVAAVQALVAKCNATYEKEHPQQLWPHAPVEEPTQAPRLSLVSNLYTCDSRRRANTVPGHQLINQLIGDLMQLKSKGTTEYEIWKAVLVQAESGDPVFMVNVAIGLARFNSRESFDVALENYLDMLGARHKASPRNVAGVVLSLLYTDSCDISAIKSITMSEPQMRNKSYAKFMHYFLAGLASNQEYVLNACKTAEYKITAIQAIVPRTPEGRRYARNYFSAHNLDEYIYFFFI